MPRIPRRFKGDEGRSTPVEQAPADAAPGQPTTTPGDPLAGEQPTTALGAVPADGQPAGATGGDPLHAPSSDAHAAPAGAVSATEASPVAPTTDATVVAPDGATVVAEQPTTVAPAVAEGDGVIVEQAPADATPRFRERTRMRRRVRYLRRLRELAFRDLGGLVFDLHRFGRERTDLVAEKLDALGRVDAELRVLETALRDRRDVTELREPGIAACPRCQALHDTDANFCPGCGTSLRGSTVRDASPVAVSPADAPLEQQPEPQPTTTAT